MKVTMKKNFMIFSSVLLSYSLKELKNIDISAFSFFVIPISITVIFFFVMVSGIYSNDIYIVFGSQPKGAPKNYAITNILLRTTPEALLYVIVHNCTRFVFHLFKNLTVRTTCYNDYDDLRERERKNSELADVITTINGFWKIHKFQLKLNYYILIPTTTTCVARPLPLLNLRWRVYLGGKFYLIFVRTSKLLRIFFLNWWTLEFYFKLTVWGSRHSWIASWGKNHFKIFGWESRYIFETLSISLLSLHT